MALGTAPTPGDGEASRGIQPRRSGLGIASGLVLLGLVAAVPPLAESLSDRLGPLRTGLFSSRRGHPGLPGFEPLGAAALAWPFALAVVVAACPGRRVDRAASLTLAVLVLGSGVALVWRAFDGGFTRPAVLVVSLLDLAAIPAGLWLSLIASRRTRAGGSPSSAGPEARRSVLVGRLTHFVAVAFAFVVVTGHAWDVFSELISRSKPVRDFVMRIGEGVPPPGRPPRRESGPVRSARRHLNAAMELNATRRYHEAKLAYDRAIDSYTALAATSGADNPFRRPLSLALNNQAWLLATCPEVDLGDPARAVALAELAVRIVPEDANCWNTLGVALYRADRGDEALEALGRSMKLRDGGDGADWYPVAMVHSRLGHAAEATDWFDKAERWVERTRPLDEDLHRLRAEAARTLGRPVPPPPTISDLRQPFPPAPRRPSPPRRPRSGEAKGEPLPTRLPSP